MDRKKTSKHPQISERLGPVRLRLYVSGQSDYTRSVLNTLEEVVRRYDAETLNVEVRDASEADETERVFFTPMLIAEDRRERGRRTVVVGDLRKPQVVSDLLASYGVHPRL